VEKLSCLKPDLKEAFTGRAGKPRGRPETWSVSQKLSLFSFVQSKRKTKENKGAAKK